MRIQLFDNAYPGWIAFFQQPNESRACQLVTTNDILGINLHTNQSTLFSSGLHIFNCLFDRVL
jgi:hypothetical protein